MGGLRLSACFFPAQPGPRSPRPRPPSLPVPMAFSTCQGLWPVAGLGTLGWSPSAVSLGEPLWAKISPVPAPPAPASTGRASSPPAPSSGLWDRERAEGLAVHTNGLPIVKAPLCRRAPLRRLWGGHNGGSVPEFPQTVTCFQSLPPPPPPPAPVSGGPRERGGVGPGPGGMDGRGPPPLWEQAPEMGTGGERPQLPGGGDGGAVCGGSWNAGSVRPAVGKGCSRRPLLRSTCPAWAHGCPPGPLLHGAHICGDTQAHSHLCNPTHGSHTRAPEPGPAVLPPSSGVCTCTAAPCPASPRSPWPPSTGLLRRLPATTPLALAAPCCSNTGYNKFVLVVTSRM